MVSTDLIFSNVKSAFDGYIGAQVFYGCRSHNINIYSIYSKADFTKVYRDFIRDHGAPSVLRHDNAGKEKSLQVQDTHRKLLIKD